MSRGKAISMLLVIFLALVMIVSSVAFASIVSAQQICVK